MGFLQSIVLQPDPCFETATVIMIEIDHESGSNAIEHESGSNAIEHESGSNAIEYESGSIAIEYESGSIAIQINTDQSQSGLIPELNRDSFGKKYPWMFSPESKDQNIF